MAIHKAMVRISSDMVADLFTQGTPKGIECIDGFPKGATLCGASLDRDGDLLLCFSHPDLPEMPEGSAPRPYNPAYRINNG